MIRFVWWSNPILMIHNMVSSFFSHRRHVLWAAGGSGEPFAMPHQALRFLPLQMVNIKLKEGWRGGGGGYCYGSKTNVGSGVYVQHSSSRKNALLQTKVIIYWLCCARGRLHHWSNILYSHLEVHSERSRAVWKSVQKYWKYARFFVHNYPCNI